MPADDRREFDIGPASEMAKKYGWYAENRPTILVDPNEVPLHLRDLIPYAERWAIPCDITRRDYFDKQPDDDIREFARTVGARQHEINLWLDSIRGDWPKAGQQFMYLLKAWCDAATAFPDA